MLLTGLQSDDLGYGQTGVILAEVLGLPHVTLVMNIETEGAGIRVKRELEDGWFRNIDVPLPALLTIQSGATKLRYATLMGIKKARTKEVETTSRSGSGCAGAPATIRLEKIYIPGKTKKSQVFDGPAKESAAKLVEKLRFEARVI